MNEFKTARELGMFLVALGLFSLVSAEGARAAEGEKSEKSEKSNSTRFGRLIRVRLPIDGDEVEDVARHANRIVEQARREKKQPVIVFEFASPEGEDASTAASSPLGASLDLAEFISGRELAGVQTVAYIPRAAQGHAVLPVMACNKIVMARDAELGPVYREGGQVEQHHKSTYKTIALRRKTIPVSVAMGLLDPAEEVWVVDTEPAREFNTTEELAETEKNKAVKEKTVLFAKGRPGVLVGKEARALGLIDLLVKSPQDLAEKLDLPRESLFLDPSMGSEWRARQVRLEGPCTAASVDQCLRMIDEAVNQHDANFLCIWINSPGGSPTDSMRLASTIAKLPPEKIRTTAFIAEEARSDAALVALACDQVFMMQNAVLGGSGAYQADRREVDATVESIRASLAPAKGRDWSLPAAIVDPELEVFECTRLGDKRYWCNEELAENEAAEAKQKANDPDAAKDEPNWKKGQPVTTPGQPFQAGGEKAVDYGLAEEVVGSFQEYKAHFDLEDDPQLLAPSWADTLIAALASPGVAAFLLMIGGIGLYAELQAPGIGIGGFVFLVCLLLFFWANYLGGTAGWLEALLFLAGLACLLLEIFVLPGFGIFGLGGGALILFSLVLAGQTFIIPQNAYQFAQFERSLVMLGGASIGVVVGVYLVNRYLPHTPYFNKMILAPPDEAEAEVIQKRESLVDYRDLVGQTGTTTTKLVPSGKAKIGDQFVDVIAAESDIIDNGTLVIVTAVHGFRILVKPVAEV